MKKKTKKIKPVQQKAIAHEPLLSRDQINNIIFYGIIFLYAVVLLRTAWLCDDAYITFRTVDNFINGHGLTWNIAERVQSFTHPLWMFVMSFCYFITREIYWTCLIISVCISILTAYLFAKNTAGSLISVVFGISILILSKSFMDYSTSGLENPLTFLILILFFISFTKQTFDEKHVLELSLLACLGILNRLDTGLFFFPVLIHALIRFRKIRGILLIFAAFSPFFAWEIFSLIYYGFPVPNTAFAKLSTGINRNEYLNQGFAYFKNSFLKDPITPVTIFSAIILAVFYKARKFISIIAGVILYLGYILWIGGDFMSGRFFAAPLLVSVATLADRDFYIDRKIILLVPTLIVILGFSVPTVPLFSGRDFGSKRENLSDEMGIANERAFYFPMTGMFNGLPFFEKPKAQFIDTGKNSRDTDNPILVGGAVGFVGFYTGPNTYFVDYHGLGDPLLSHVPMVDEDPLYSIFCQKTLNKECRTKWRIGHFLRRIPDGYLVSVLSGENRLKDPALKAFYEKVRMITRGDIFDLDRFAEVINMNLGRYESLLKEYKDYRKYDPPDFLEVYEAFPDIRNPTVLNDAGMQYISKKDYAKAIESFSKLTAMTPENSSAWNSLGVSYYFSQDYEKAETSLNEAIKLNHEDSNPYLNLGRVRVAQGKTEEAKKLFKEAAKRGNQMAEEQLKDDGLP
jgi:arabinofuranosyltransferase